MTKDVKVLFDVCKISPAEASKRLSDTPMSILRGESLIDAFNLISGFQIIGKKT